MRLTLGTAYLTFTLDAVRVYASRSAYVQPDVGLVQSSEASGQSETASGFSNILNLLPDDYRSELLSLSQSLEVIDSSSPFCSTRVSTLLQRCTKQSLSSEDRDEAAMLLTLCDRARDYAPPMECEGLRSGAYEMEKAVLKRCAMALDQHQNFQRAFDVYRILVIPERCKSLNGIFHVDPSREIYRNITLDLVDFLQALVRKEAKSEEYFGQWDDRLQSLQYAAADLMSSKESLTDFNARFVDDMNAMIIFLNATFDEMTVKGRMSGEEISLDFRRSLSRIADEHSMSLTHTIHSMEDLAVLRMNNIFDITQGRQSSIDSAAEITIKQLVDAVAALSVARQDIEELGIFARETTAKAYNQAFLLDKKQHEVSESLSSLGSNIRGLADSTQELNVSLTNIRDEALVDFIPGNQREDSALLKLVFALKYIFAWLGLSPFWALSFLMLSLPRFLIEQVAKIALWLCAVSLSHVVRALYAYRKSSASYDPERNQYRSIDAPSPVSEARKMQSQSCQLHHHSPPQITFVPQVDKSTMSRPSSLLSTAKLHPCEKEVDRILAGWASLRFRARVTGSSRLPSRLYGSTEL